MYYIHADLHFFAPVTYPPYLPHLLVTLPKKTLKHFIVVQLKYTSWDTIMMYTSSRVLVAQQRVEWSCQLIPAH